MHNRRRQPEQIITGLGVIQYQHPSECLNRRFNKVIFLITKVSGVNLTALVHHTTIQTVQIYRHENAREKWSNCAEHVGRPEALVMHVRSRNHDPNPVL